MVEPDFPNIGQYESVRTHNDISVGDVVQITTSNYPSISLYGFEGIKDSFVSKAIKILTCRDSNSTILLIVGSCYEKHEVSIKAEGTVSSSLFFMCQKNLSWFLE